MNFLESGLTLKIIPDNLKNIKSGEILEVKENVFTVKVVNSSEIFCKDEEVELLVNVNSGVLKFVTTIETIKNDVITFVIPEKFTTVQRREYPRININIPVVIEKNENPVEETETQDISGGGMKVHSDKEMENGTELVAKIKIANGKNIKTVFKVLRTAKELNSKKEYIISGKFSDITHSDRTAIIQLCFKKQLEQKFKRMRTD